MTPTELEDRIRRTYHVVVPHLVGAQPAAAREKGADHPYVDGEPARRGPQRRILVAAAVAAVLALGGLTLARSSTGGDVGRADRVGQVMVAAGVDVPAALPAGFRFDSATVQGSAAATVDPTSRLLVLADPADPNRQINVRGWLNGDDQAEWAVNTRQLLPTTVSGARGASYAMNENGVLSLYWAADGNSYDITSIGVSLPSLQALAASATFAADGRLVVADAPVSLARLYDGIGVGEGLRVDVGYRSATADGATLDVSLVGAEVWRSPAQHFGRGAAVQVGGHSALYYETGPSRMVAWLTVAGTQVRVVADGLGRDEVLAVAASMRPLDAEHWEALRTSVAADRIQNLLASAPGAAPAAGGASPTTAVAVVPQPPADEFGDAGLDAGAVPPGTLARISGVGSRQTNGLAVVHTADDRWVGIIDSVEMGIREGCVTEPHVRDGALVGWAAACTGATYAPDGACVSEACFVGLRTFEVRVTNGRVEAAPNRFHAGVPRASAVG